MSEARLMSSIGVGVGHVIDVIDVDCRSPAPYIDRVLGLERLSRRVDCVGVRVAFGLVSRRV